MYNKVIMMEFRHPNFLKLKDWNSIKQLCEYSNKVSLFHEINWNRISNNPAIFTYDYDKIKITNKQINKEVVEFYWHPKKMNLWMWQEDD
jgi:hypothetical protein